MSAPIGSVEWRTERLERIREHDAARAAGRRADLMAWLTEKATHTPECDAKATPYDNADCLCDAWRFEAVLEALRGRA